MAKLNHKTIDNTKEGVKQIIKYMETVSDSFVDFLVQNAPKTFEEKEGDKDSSMISPFGILPLLFKQIEMQYQTHQKELERTGEINKAGDVVDMFKKPRLDN